MNSKAKPPSQSENLTQKLHEILQVIDSEIAICCGKISTYPDNPDISRLSGHPNCFTIRSASIFANKNANLDPFFYAWKEQYQLVKTLLEQHQFSHVAFLISGGRIRFGGETRTLALPVREKIADITGDLLAPLRPVLTQDEMEYIKPKQISTPSLQKRRRM